MSGAVASRRGGRSGGARLESITDHGAKPDAFQVTDGAITQGTNLLSTSQVTLTPANVGQVVMIPGAGASATPLPFFGYISSVSGGVASLVTHPGGSVPAYASATVSRANVTIATPIDSAVAAALSTGNRAYLPAGKYVWAENITPTNVPALKGDGSGRTIVYYTSANNLLTYTSNAGGLQGTSAALAVTANRGDTSLSMAAVPSAVVPGGYAFLSSNTVFSSIFSYCTLGEFVRVIGISGTTIYLDSPVVGPFSYTTAAAAKLQAVSFVEGVSMEGIEFVNVTPESLSGLGTASQAAEVTSAGFGGVAGPFQFRFTDSAEMKDIKAVGHAGGFIVLENSIKGRVSNFHVRDAALDPAGNHSYGYGVNLTGSMWCRMWDSTQETGHALVNCTGSGQTAGDLALPASANEIHDCSSINGLSEPFLFHPHTAYNTFRDCKVRGGAFFVPETQHQIGFDIEGQGNRAIGCTVEDVPWFGMVMGGDKCEAIRCVFRNIVPANVNGAIVSNMAIKVTGTNARIVDIDVDGVVHPSGATARGIWPQIGATGLEVTGGTMRNIGDIPVEILDTSNTEKIRGLKIYTSGAGTATFAIKTSAAAPTVKQWDVFIGPNCNFQAPSNQMSGFYQKVTPTVTSGVAVQDATSLDSSVYIPLTGITGGTYTIAYGPDNTTGITLVSAGVIPDGATIIPQIRLPARWWYKITVTSATIGTVTQVAA